jgi:hypothetical protein
VASGRYGVFVLMASLLVTTACGRQGPTASASNSPSGGVASGSTFAGAITQVGWVNSTLGWVLTGSTLHLTTDGDNVVGSVSLPLQPFSGQSVEVASTQDITEVGVSGTVLVQEHTANGGASWALSTLEQSAETLAGFTSVSLAGATGTVSDALATTANSQFSSGLLYRSQSGGTWTVAQAPTGGTLSSGGAGTLFLTGGAVSQLLFRSTDGGASWTPVQVQIPAGSASGELSLVPPTVLGDGQIVLPVTVYVPTSTVADEVFEVSSNGGTSFAQEGPEVTLSGGWGLGATPKVAIVSPTDWLIYESVGGRIQVNGPSATTGTVSSPTGLTGTVEEITFGSPTLAWALVRANGARGDSLLVSKDGGSTWSAATFG